jgi:hypothetical protein
VTVDDGRYPQDINLEFVKDKIALLNELEPGQAVRVSFDIRGREYNGRYYNNLQAWKVEQIDGDAPDATSSLYSEDPPPVGDEDIPF